MVKRKTVALMFLALLLAALPAFAGEQAQPGQGKGKRGGSEGEGMHAGCLQNLNFSQEQTTKLQQVRNAFFKDTTGLRADVFKKELELDALMLDRVVDAEKAKKLQEEISGLMAQLAQKRLQAKLEARKLLTPEQFSQISPGCDMGIGPGGGRGFGFEHGGGRGSGDGRGSGQGPGAR